MTAFAELFADVAFPTLLESHGEEITYKPRNGLPRVITVIVERFPPEFLDQIQNGVCPRWVIKTYNDERTGIASHLLDTGGDKIEISKRVGGPVESRSLVTLMGSSNGACRIEVR